MKLEAILLYWGNERHSAAVAVLVWVGLTISCGEIPSSSHDASTHVIPAECVDGEHRCEVNRMVTCVGGHFGSVSYCPNYCDPVEGCVGDHENVDSFIWIANTGEGTLSKVDTRLAKEVARYLTCYYSDSICDPSRTSVNLRGDVVVTNRGCDRCDEHLSASSVTKFAANIVDCVDRNGNGTIETSSGPTDVKAWGEDECMIWSTELPDATELVDRPHGARATAWDGQTDEETGQGGHVWVGTCGPPFGPPVRLYRLDGDTGLVDERVEIEDVNCAYGAAVDNNNGFWFFGNGSDSITRLDMVSLSYETRSTSCGYGITIDAQGRVWTGGFTFQDGVEEKSCVARYDPRTGIEDMVIVPWDLNWHEDPPWFRGIAVGVASSAGYVWAAETSGVLYQIDADTMEVRPVAELGSSREMIGVAVDYLGYVWTVDRLSSSVHKYDPATFQRLEVPIGFRPYTYSDMTGVQLRNAVIVR